MTDQANVLRTLMERCHAISSWATDAEPGSPAVRAHTIAVTGGKGGVGKSNIALNAAIAMAEQETTVCLLDANPGLGNIDLLCGLNGYWNLSHVVTGARTLREIVLHGPGGVDVIPGVSGLNDLADCAESVQTDIFNQLRVLDEQYDYILIDTGTGIDRSVRRFITASDLVLIVTTPEPTAVADAYATIKSLSSVEELQLDVLVNRAVSSDQADVIIDRLRQTSQLFLRTNVESMGFLPRDESIPDAVTRRIPFLLHNPESPASRAVRQLARRLKNRAGRQTPHESFFSRIRKRGPVKQDL